MMGFQIFMHSIRMVFGNLGMALRITGILYLVSSIAFFMMPTATDPVAWLFTILIILVGIFLFVWMAVGWHRYILLGEVPPSFLPSFDRERLMAYALRSLLFILIGVPVWVVGSFIVGVLGAVLNSPVMAVAAIFILVFITMVVGYRLAPVLPAVAVDHDLGIGETWAATRGANWAIVVVAILSAIGATVIDLPASLFLSTSGWMLGVVWLAITGWIKMLVGVTILTTLYGHYVEDRPLGRSGDLQTTS